MDRFEAAKWMVEHPGQRMVDSDGDEWWWCDSRECFLLNGKGGEPFCSCVVGLRFKPKKKSIKPHTRTTMPSRSDGKGGYPSVWIPRRFEGRTVKIRVQVCDE
jgi:hypothetical protein